MNRPKPPQLLTNLYRDLRDRHLLLPTVALIVALVAIPVLLSKSHSATKSPLPAVSVHSSHSSAITSAVLADSQVSVRNYRKRLAELKSKNPFKVQFTGVAASGNDGAATGNPVGDASAGATATGSTPTGQVPVTTEQTQTTETTTQTTTTGGTTTGGNGDTKPHNPSPTDVQVVNHLFTRRVDLMIGLEGNPKLHENVKPMTILPDDATPVVAFLGTDEAGKRAAFVVSKDATVVASEGACVPVPENCLYLTLKKGQSATLDFGPDGQTFDLRLLAIRDVEVPAE